MVNHRLLKEFKELSTAKPDPDIALALADEADIFVWGARLRGPSGTPYENGVFELSVKCPTTYPLAPPNVSFVTPIFHPNVLFRTGEPARAGAGKNLSAQQPAGSGGPSHKFAARAEQVRSASTS